MLKGKKFDAFTLIHDLEKSRQSECKLDEKCYFVAYMIISLK